MAEFVPSDFVSDGHKYGWRFAKVWGTENPKGNPIAHIMIFHQLKFKAEIDGKTYTLGARSCYQNFDGSSQNILTGLNGYRSGSKSWLYVLYYDPEKPDAPDHKAGRPGTSIPSKITLEENEFICRLTVSTKSSDRAETTDVNEYSMGHMFAPLRTSLSDGLYSKWWCKIGILDDDGWDFCFEFDQTTSPKITGFSVSLENTTPSPGIPTEENQLTEANGLYLYMDDQAEIQVGGCRTNQELPAAFDSASIKSIELAVTKPLELRYKHTDGTIYELKSGTKVDTSNLVSLDGEQTITGAKSFDAAVTLNAEGTEPQHAVTKSYVDSKVTEGAQGALEGVAKLDATQTFTGANTFSGATNFTGAVTGADPQNATELATKQYVDSKVGEAAGAADNVVTLDGEQTITGVKTFSAAPVISVAPTEANHAATKAYVDTLAPTGSNPNVAKATQSITLTPTLTGWNQRHFVNDLRIYTKENQRISFKYVPSDCTGTKTFIGVVDGVGSGRAEAKDDSFLSSYELQPNEFKGSVTFYPGVNGANASLASLGIQLFGYEDSLCIHAIPPADGASGIRIKDVGLVRFDFEAPYVDRLSFFMNTSERREPADMAEPNQLRSLTELVVGYTCEGYAYSSLRYTQNQLGTDTLGWYRVSELADQFTPKFPICPNYAHVTAADTDRSSFQITVKGGQYTYQGVNGANRWYTTKIAIRNLKWMTTAGPLYLKYYPSSMSWASNAMSGTTYYYVLTLDECIPEGKAKTFLDDYEVTSREVKCSTSNTMFLPEGGRGFDKLFFNSTSTDPAVYLLRRNYDADGEPIGSNSEGYLIMDLQFKLSQFNAVITGVSFEFVHDDAHPEWTPADGYTVSPLAANDTTTYSLSDMPAADLTEMKLYNTAFSDLANGRIAYSSGSLKDYPATATFIERTVALSQISLNYKNIKGVVIQDAPTAAVVSTFSPQMISGQKTFSYPPRAMLPPQVDTDCCNKYYVDKQIEALEARIAALESAAAGS